MQNSNKSAASRGVVLFALNTQVDYVHIADQASRLIQHTLGLPVTLITDDQGQPKFAYDRVVRISKSHDENVRAAANEQIIPWRNFDRYLAYELSPYDETILLDSDYLVLDNSLGTLFDTDFDYKLTHWNQTPGVAGNEVMGVTSLPYIWATVVLFRKCPRSQMLFDMVGRIQRNYTYYRALFNIHQVNYRNDFGFTMANVILNGYSLNESQSIPWSMLSLYHDVETITTMGNFLKINHPVVDGHRWPLTTVLVKQNLHILDKDYLQSENFDQFVKAICESA